MASAPLRVALVLGSGGARGYAHLGAVRVLRERGHEIVSVAGTSMGALVGGLVAVERDEDFAAWAVGLTQRDVFRLLDPVLSAGGVFRAERVLDVVGEMLGDVHIEDLPIPYTAVATDLQTRREVWFQRGPLREAIRASIALPGAITPVVINGRLLADGGMVNPVPVEPTRASDADLTVAVSLLGSRSPDVRESPAKETSEARPREEWAGRLRRSAAGLLERERLRALPHRLSRRGPNGENGERVQGEKDGADHESAAAAEAARSAASVASATGGKLGLIDVVTMSLETTSELIARYRMASNPPDVLVTVPANACGTLEFHRAEEMIALGRRLTEEALDRAGY